MKVEDIKVPEGKMLIVEVSPNYMEELEIPMAHDDYDTQYRKGSVVVSEKYSADTFIVFDDVEELIIMVNGFAYSIIDEQDVILFVPNPQ